MVFDGLSAFAPNFFRFDHFFLPLDDHVLRDCVALQNNGV